MQFFLKKPILFSTPGIINCWNFQNWNYIQFLVNFIPYEDFSIFCDFNSSHVYLLPLVLGQTISKTIRVLNLLFCGLHYDSVHPVIYRYLFLYARVVHSRHFSLTSSPFPAHHKNQYHLSLWRLCQLKLNSHDQKCFHTLKKK